MRLDALSTTSPQIRHTVTAIVVAHDGAHLLPGLMRAVHAQTYPVEQIVGVDTGSRDRSGAMLAELIGQDAVFGVARDTGYGEAVAVAARQGGAGRGVQRDTDQQRIEWIWLLHDDCEPAPETLERLLRAASRDRSVVVLGPKVLDGSDRRVLREAGISIDRAGRRITGIEPGEIDQGQHDANRAVLAVGSAGMLIRRDAWEHLGGFDPRLKLFRDDLDFCWRTHAAGYRVRVVTDAVIYHRELSARGRRTRGSRHPRRLDRRNALYVLAVNLPLLAMLRIMTGCVAGSLVRAAYFLLTKQTDLAAAQLYAVTGLFGHPIRLWRARRRRARGRRVGYAAVRTLIPPGRTLFRLAESIAGLLSSGPPQASGAMHRAASDEPEEEQFVDTQSAIRRVIANPGVQLVAVLLVIALAAERRLLGTNPLGGGALVPAWGGSSVLWHEYLAGFHPTGVGSAASAPPYLAVVAALATVLGGQAWLAVDVLLLGCVPLAGMTAYLAAGRLVAATAARVWIAAAYALLPVAMGAVAAGRLGTAFAFTVLPLIAMSAGRILTAPPRPARRAAWATGLLVGLAAAFVPLLWVLGVVFAVAALASRRWLWPVPVTNAVIVAATPFAVLFPWSLHLFASPSAFLAEAGLQPGGLTTAGLPASSLLLLSPGGPGLPPAWVTVGIGLAVLATLLPGRRTALVAAGWCVAAAGFLAAIVISRATVTPAGGPAASGWPGPALAIAAVGLLLAAAPAAEWLATRPRRTQAALGLAVVASAPVLAAGYWVSGGVRGPVQVVSSPVLPAFVAASSAGQSGYRTLILRPDGASLDYSVVRQSDPTLGEPELAGYAPAEQALSGQVAALAAPDGADAGDPGQQLGQFGIRWVLLPGPVNQVLALRLDAAVGLIPLSKSPAYDLWQVAGPVAEVRVIGPDGTVTPLPSQPSGVNGASAPAAGGTLVLAEPQGGWAATLNGKALTPVRAPVDGWAQGFVLPPGGGRLAVSRNDTARDLSLIAELIVLLAVCVLALPGKRAGTAEDTEAMAAVRAAQHSRRVARAVGATRAARAIRRRAAASPGDGDIPVADGVSVADDIPVADGVAAVGGNAAGEDAGAEISTGAESGAGVSVGVLADTDEPRDAVPPWEQTEAPEEASWERAPWEGAEPTWTGPEPVWTQAEPTWSGPKSTWTEPEPIRTGPKPTWTGAEPVSERAEERDGPPPEESPRPAALPPWGTGKWGLAPEWNETPRRVDTPQHGDAPYRSDTPRWNEAPEPAGTRDWDQTPAQPEPPGQEEATARYEPPEPEPSGAPQAEPAGRRSHRAGRHGRSGRRRGFGGRGGRNGES
ncbi:MAG TPA: glycosyltransferase [Trebonia sp.]